MPPPRPPPNTQCGSHGVWRWETARACAPPRSLHAPRLPVTPTVSTNADSLASACSTIGHTIFLAGVWGEASPQAPPEGAGGAREEAHSHQAKK